MRPNGPIVTACGRVIGRHEKIHLKGEMGSVLKYVSCLQALEEFQKVVLVLSRPVRAEFVAQVAVAGQARIKGERPLALAEHEAPGSFIGRLQQRLQGRH